MIPFTLMSLVTIVKDYVEITHKLIEIEPLKNYTEYGAVFTYFIFSIGDFFKHVFSFSLFKNIWSIPMIIPDIASSMISEISVIDSYNHNAFTFLETNLKTSTNPNLVIFEKFMIGLINSLFLILPTSTSHLITLRRFVMQGLEAGYMASLGTLTGNLLWLSSIILGLRFIVIPWLSLDLFRYLLGFILLVKYIWDSTKERRLVVEDLSKWKIFLLNFLLTFTEQSCIYPFISNVSIGPDASILEGFPAESFSSFLAVHVAYLFGILVGSLSLLQLTCWFWENPAFSIYIWITTKSSLKISTSSYFKVINFGLLYATMFCAIASIPYYGLDYTITNPIGLVPQDRILYQKKKQADPQKIIPETAFLGIKATDKNSRIRVGGHGRRERWKQHLIKYQAFDASLYNQGIYDYFTVEDLNYGFDRFWLRRKMRNHHMRFILFPGPWMRSVKKQFNNPTNQTLENSNKTASGPRVEFFRILFEQFYHPNFHQRIFLESKLTKDSNTDKKTKKKTIKQTSGIYNNLRPNIIIPEGEYAQPFTKSKKLVTTLKVKPGLIFSTSALRKYVRNVNTRINLKLLTTKQINLGKDNITKQYNTKLIYSKRWKSFFSKIQPLTKTKSRKYYQLFRNLAKQVLLTPEAKSLKDTTISLFHKSTKSQQKNRQSQLKLLKKLTQYKNKNSVDQLLLLRPLKIYLQKEQAFKRKLRYYGTIPIRKLTVGYQAPFFKALMKRGFYYYKPSLRRKKTLYLARISRGLRKQTRKQRITPTFSVGGEQRSAGRQEEVTHITKPTHSYTVFSKRTRRYRHQIYKDVIQHWYYTPFNRLLLKYDIDAFINRQPKPHFLTKNEERLLHLRRFLLSEHYDTLRWYTTMQHYQTMKTNIGGTKSFANRIYNQQFQGTLKKIRHLFAITPKQSDLSTLKFDLLLYNDNKLKDNVYFHEELLTDCYLNYLLPAKPTTNNVIVKSAITNNSLQITLENKNDKTLEDTVQQTNIGSLVLDKTMVDKKSVLKTNNNFIYSELFVNLIKQCKKRVQNRKILRRYLTYLLYKRKKRNLLKTNRKERSLRKLEFVMQNNMFMPVNKNNKRRRREHSLTVSSLQKAVNESIVYSNIKEMVDSPLKTTNKKLKKAYARRTEDLILNQLNLINQITLADKKQPTVTTVIQRTITKTSFGPTRSLEKAKQLLKTIINSFKPFLRGQLMLKARTDKKIQWWRKKQKAIRKRRKSRKRYRFDKPAADADDLILQRFLDYHQRMLDENNGKYDFTVFNALFGEPHLYDDLLSKPKKHTKRLTDSRVLRKKQDNHTAFFLGIDTKKNQITNDTKNKNQFQQSKKNGKKPTLWQAFFSQKFRKKRASRGRRYRSRMARYFTRTRKKRRTPIEGFTKNAYRRNINGAYPTKEEKQEALNRIIKNKQKATNTIKKSRIKKRRRHRWKRRVRHRFSRNHYRYLKRYRLSKGKLRVMNKKIKKIKATNELRQWWWKSFLPRYLYNLQKKPLKKQLSDNIIGIADASSVAKPSSNIDITKSEPNQKVFNYIAQQFFNYLNSSLDIAITPNVNRNLGGSVSPYGGHTTSLPFYAGWDECLRKFVVTNRLFSRRDTGLTVRETQKINSPETLFTIAPIQGLNQGSLFYWHTDMPFNSYNIDRFFRIKQRCFTPLGWRRFVFRHNILIPWVHSLRLSKKNKLKRKKINQTLIVSMKNLRPFNDHLQTQKQEKIKTKYKAARRIKKRFRLIKKTRYQFMYCPTGPLLTQVLPSHYLSVFNQQRRSPPNRYLRRKTLNRILPPTIAAMHDLADWKTVRNQQFTLRKRVKPRRKKHRKRFIKKYGLVFPRRTKFTRLTKVKPRKNLKKLIRTRPSSRWKPSIPLRIKSNKRVKRNPQRLRRKQRRGLKQRLKQIQRYLPRYGGFTWPGDYLRLEVIGLPILKNTNVKQRRLKKFGYLPVEPLSRKYLIEKHNIKVLKKKLEKAYNLPKHFCSQPKQ